MLILPPDPAGTAQHEAAHVVVGVALGLKLRRARIGRVALAGALLDGYAWFAGTGRRQKVAFATMYAAGAAWTRRAGDPAWHAHTDLRLARECVRSAHDLESCVRAADAILDSRARIHDQVSRLLLEVHDITGADVEALVLR